jgi:hypothetical protein
VIKKTTLIESSSNQYADDYCDNMIKSILDDPQVDKKAFISKLISHF